MVGVYLNKEEKINQNPIYQRIRYNGHIINLAIQAFLFKDVISTKQIQLYKVEDESRDEISEVHLAIRRDTFRYIGVLGKLYNIIVYI